MKLNVDNKIQQFCRTPGEKEWKKEVFFHFLSTTGRPAFFDRWTARVAGIVNRRSAIFAASCAAGLLAANSNGDPLDSWTIQPSGTSNHLGGVVYGKQTFVAVGTNGVVLSSTDATTWVSRNSGTTNMLNDIAYGNGTFVAAGANGTILSSTNAVDWTSQTSGFGGAFHRMAYLNGLFFAVGYSGTIETSPDGVSWTPRVSGTTNSLHTILRANGKFIAAGYQGTLVTSADGITWTSVNSGAASTFYASVYGDGAYLLMGYQGTMIASPDTVTWGVRNSQSTNTLKSALNLNGTFVVVGLRGAILTSADGLAWTNRNSSTTHGLQGLAFGQGVCVAVGNQGTILKSALIPSLPVVVNQPQNILVAQGNTANFSVTATGAPPLTYQWRFNGAPIAAATASSYAITNTQPAEGGAYSVLISNSWGSITSSDALLTVCATISASGPVNQTNCPGTSVILSTVASGTGPFSYQWAKDGMFIPNATSSAYSITQAAASDAGKYSVITSGPCTSVTNTAGLVVNEPTTAGPLGDLTRSPGNAVTFTAAAAGTGPFSYLWEKNGTPMPSQTNSSFTISSVSSTDAGAYDVRVTGACTTTTATGSLTVSNAGPFMLDPQLFTTNGTPSLRVWLASGQAYVLESSSNLSTWVPVFTNQTGAAGSNFIKVNLTNPMNAFFRAKVLP